MELDLAVSFVSSLDQLEAATAETISGLTKSEKEELNKTINGFIESKNVYLNSIATFAVAGMARAMFNSLKNEPIENIT